MSIPPAAISLWQLQNCFQQHAGTPVYCWGSSGEIRGASCTVTVLNELTELGSPKSIWTCAYNFAGTDPKQTHLYCGSLSLHKGTNVPLLRGHLDYAAVPFWCGVLENSGDISGLAIQKQLTFSTITYFSATSFGKDKQLWTAIPLGLVKEESLKTSDYFMCQMGKRRNMCEMCDFLQGWRGFRLEKNTWDGFSITLLRK